MMKIILKKLKIKTLNNCKGYKEYKKLYEK